MARSSAESVVPTIHTHHCLCTNLVLATTYDLVKCTRRASPSLDRAFILPCPRASRRKNAGQAESDSEEEESAPEALRRMSNYTLLISLNAPTKQAPVMVRREDGFEKRWLLKCGRCALVVGYQLDHAQYGQDETMNERDAKKGRREDVVYVLPGATTTTEQMRDGWKPPNESIDFGLSK